MSDNTAISWSDATWNVMLGCSKVSAGCQLCYAVNHVHRMAGNPNPKIRAANTGLTKRHKNGMLDWNGVLRFEATRLDQPRRWKKPRRIFVNALSDVFHEDASVWWQDAMFNMMESCSQHQFQVLTKRPHLMRDYLSYRWQAKEPAPNIWLGTSVENQAAADERIPWLLDTPAAVRFLSAEPLLGPIDLDPYLWEDAGPAWAGRNLADPYISWVIAGGESGKGARPMHPSWVRSLRDQCTAAGVPFHFKQWGEFTPKEKTGQPCPEHWGTITHDGHYFPLTTPWTGQDMTDPTSEAVVYRVGKKKAGHLLDGAVWHQFPAVAS